MQLIRSKPLLKASSALPAEFRPEEPETPLHFAGRVGLYSAAGTAAGLAVVAPRAVAIGAHLARNRAQRTIQPVAAAGAKAAEYAGRKAVQAHTAGLRAAASPRAAEAAAMDTETPIGRVVNAIHQGAKAKLKSATPAAPALRAAGAGIPLSAVRRGTTMRAAARAFAPPSSLASRIGRFARTALGKAAPARAWDADKHPRDARGEFTGKGDGAGPTPEEANDHRSRIEAAVNGTTGHKPWDDAVARLHARGRKPWIRVRPDGSVGVSTGDRMRTVAGPRSTPEAPSTHQRPAPVVDLAERRTQARMSRLYQTASKTKELPESYTGSKTPELPIGSFVHQAFDIHKPAALTPAEHEGVRHGLVSIINAEREGTLAAGTIPKKRGKLRGKTLIPEGTPRSLVKKAYRHGAYRAMHRFGLGHYSYQMDPELQQQMKPLEHFTLYAERRVQARMLGELKGQWKPYRREFGIPFKDNRTDPRTGEVRFRARPLPPIIKADGVFDDQRADGSYDLAKKAPKATEPTDDQVELAQTAGGAIGTAAGTYAAVRATKGGIDRLSQTIGRNTAAGVRLSARSAGYARGVVQSTVRDQSRILGHVSGAHFRGLAGAAAALTGAAFGNYAGDKIARRVVGAKGTQDDYKPGGAQDFAALVGGAVVGHKLAHLGKAVDAAPKKDKDTDTLLQPMQAVPGAFTGTLTAAATHHYLHEPLDRLSHKVGQAAGRAFARTAHEAGGVVRGAPRLLRAHEFAGIRHGAALATKHGLGGLAVGAASLAGDFLGDKISRTISGKTGNQDEFRHSSLLGATLGSIGLIAGHHYGSSSAFRANRRSPMRAAAHGIAAGVAGDVVGEAAGNILDEKTGATDAVASINRRTLHRLGAR